MGLHKRHVPGQVDGTVKFALGPDGKLRPVRPPSDVHPETIAEEKPPQPPDPRPIVPPHVGPG